tara:strand:- start:290 stop:730 length:441 start_codon:yes stop_codon:yes gene_type:complete
MNLRGETEKAEVLNSYCDKWGKKCFITHLGFYLVINSYEPYYEPYNIENGTKEELKNWFDGIVKSFDSIEALCGATEAKFFESLMNHLWLPYRKKKSYLSRLVCTPAKEPPNSGTIKNIQGVQNDDSLTADEKREKILMLLKHGEI